MQQVAELLATPHRTFILAEAGVNHDGDVEQAKRLVEAARAAGVDAVKFQTWRPGECTGRFAFKVDYLKKTSPEDESRFELSRRLCLPYDAFRQIKAHCDQIGVPFLSTPDGFESLDFLVDELDMPVIKVSSTELTHVQFLEAVGAKNRPVILSTGLGTLGEVERALAALRRRGRPAVTLLHCTSAYPAPPQEINLRAMQTMAAAFGLPVGLSDHSLGLEAAIAAVALGARIIEKHFTLDRGLPGPDHQASLEPAELAELVRAVRKVEAMLGDGVKRPAPSEAKNLAGIRRSVVAARPIAAGTVLTADMLTCKRPGTGLAPELLDQVVGLTVNRSLEEDEPLTWEHLR